MITSSTSRPEKEPDLAPPDPGVDHHRAGPAHELAELRAGAYRLTGREREVAATIVRGLANPQIAGGSW